MLLQSDTLLFKHKSFPQFYNKTLTSTGPSSQVVTNNNATASIALFINKVKYLKVMTKTENSKDCKILL